MKFGLFGTLITNVSTPEVAVTMAAEAESRGMDSIWMGEHVVLFDRYDSKYPYDPSEKIPLGGPIGFHDPLIAMAYLAQCTQKIRFGTGILLLAQRNPVQTAKEIATLDYLSGGRVDLGVGVGWLREEFEALNAPFEHRGRRLDAYIDVLKACWCQDPSSYDGEFYHLPACRVQPKPAQKPHPPIVVGGNSDPALRRAARLGQGWFGYKLAPDQLGERVARLADFLGHEGRLLDDLEITVCPGPQKLTPQAVAEYAKAGADQVVAIAVAPSQDQMVAVIAGLGECLDAAKSLGPTKKPRDWESRS